MANLEDPHKKMPMPSNRAFGGVMAVFFGVVGAWPLWNGGAARSWALIAAVAVGCLAVFAPRLLSVPNRLWMRLGDLLHAIVSPVALAVVFVCAVIPTGLLLRAFGRQPLQLSFDPIARSYWVSREPPGPFPQSFIDQF